MEKNVFDVFSLMKTYELTSVWVLDPDKVHYFTEENTKDVLSAFVVEGDYGLSVKIKRQGKDGKQYVSFQPLSRESRFMIGDKVDLLKCKMICLTKGDETIWRLEEI